MTLSIPLSRRVIGVAAAAVVVLAAGLIVALVHGGGPDVRLSAPPYAADPVPKPKTIDTRAVPADCGVRKATRHRYAPGADDSGGKPGRLQNLIGHSSTQGWGCEWRGQGGRRTLKVDLKTEFARNPLESIGSTSTPSTDGDALRLMNPADPEPIAAGSPARPVGGLGEEALYQYSPGFDDGDKDAQGAVLRFRVGASVVTVTYGGVDRAKDDSLRVIPEKRARAGVFAAAADAARALHVPATPAFTPATVGAPPPIAHPVRPCDLVPANLADTLAPGAVRTRPQSVGPTDQHIQLMPSYGEAVDTCRWYLDEPEQNSDGDSIGDKRRDLSVTVLTEANWRPGIAVPQATRQFQTLYDDARGTGSQDFHAVRGLGDQGFVTYLPAPFQDPGTYAVIFRRGAVIVAVSYSGSDPGGDPESGRALDVTTQINGAYTVAARAEEALR